MSITQRLRTFPRGLWWVGAFSFCYTCVLGALIVSLTGAWCNALEHYRITTLGELLFGLFMIAVYAPLVFWLGVRAYRYFRLRWPTLSTISGTITYCIALAIIVFPLQFLRIPANLWRYAPQNAICAKSTSDGMFTRSEGLTSEEYAYLQGMLTLLPDLPVEPDSINVFYYSDGFLPDFAIKVRCAVARGSANGYPPYVRISKDGPTGWMLDTTSTDQRIVWLVFEDGES